MRPVGLGAEPGRLSCCSQAAALARAAAALAAPAAPLFLPPLPAAPPLQTQQAAAGASAAAPGERTCLLSFSGLRIQEITLDNLCIAVICPLFCGSETMHARCCRSPQMPCGVHAEHPAITQLTDMLKQVLGSQLTTGLFLVLRRVNGPERGPVVGGRARRGDARATRVAAAARVPAGHVPPAAAAAAAGRRRSPAKPGQPGRASEPCRCVGVHTTVKAEPVHLSLPCQRPVL